MTDFIRCHQGIWRLHSSSKAALLTRGCNGQSLSWCIIPGFEGKEERGWEGDNAGDVSSWIRFGRYHVDAIFVAGDYTHAHLPAAPCFGAERRESMRTFKYIIKQSPVISLPICSRVIIGFTRKVEGELS